MVALGEGAVSYERGSLVCHNTMLGSNFTKMRYEHATHNTCLGLVLRLGLAPSELGLLGEAGDVHPLIAQFLDYSCR